MKLNKTKSGRPIFLGGWEGHYILELAILMRDMGDILSEKL